MNALLLLALLLPTQGLDPMHGEDAASLIEVSWKGKDYPGNTLPKELGDGPFVAVSSWAGWCLEHEYQMTLVPDGRVLLISPEKNGKLGRQLKLIASTQREFDQLLPAPKRVDPGTAEDEDSDPGEGDDSGEIPEDPEGRSTGWTPRHEEPGTYSYSYEFGAGTWPVDTETCVMFVVNGEKDYGSLVETLGEMEEYLKPWVEAGKKLTGFVHERPLVAAYVENAVGQEEWDPENELVHRVTQLLFVRRFSSIQPYWVTQGFSWHLENKLRRSIYCFPYRHEFVWATEHTGWDNELRNLFKDRKKDPLQATEFADWKRGKYDGDLAKLSFGLVGFIARYYPEQFTPFLEDMRLFALEDSKEETGDGNWERRSDYALSAEDQHRLLKQHFGEDCLEDAGEYFRRGKRFKPKKK